MSARQEKVREALVAGLEDRLSGAEFDAAEAEVEEWEARANRIPYPTEWAYEQACAALEKYKARAEAFQAILEDIAADESDASGLARRALEKT